VQRTAKSGKHAPAAAGLAAWRDQLVMPLKVRFLLATLSLCFVCCVLKTWGIQGRLSAALLDAVTRDRQGDISSRALVAAVLQSLGTLLRCAFSLALFSYPRCTAILFLPYIP
jgi:hypothetical protein